MDFKTLQEIEDVQGKRVLVRVDWNVPLENGVVVEDFRIKESLPTIEYLRKAGAKVILMGHLESKETHSFESVYEYAATILPLSFSKDIEGEEVLRKVNELVEGEVLLLENLRTNPGEKENSRDFAVALAKLGDLYVNEAFSAAHREHASIVGIPKLLPAYAGLRFTEEVKTLSKAFYPRHPFLFILGGAKFETKIPLIQKFAAIADSLFVGGALAHNFFVEQGKSVGASLVSDGNFNLMPLLETGKVMIPDELVIKQGEVTRQGYIEDIIPGDMIVDAGPKTLEYIKAKIQTSEFILWNGPLGLYEGGYKEGTLRLAELLAASRKEVIVGGADTLATIKEQNLWGKFSFISTGGGAMLDFLSSGSLPGIDALKRI